MNHALSVNPFYAARIKRAVSPKPGRLDPRADRAAYAKLPRVPINGSPVPELTSLYHNDQPGPYGDRNYPGNCSGNLIKDLLRYFQPASVYDPMTGSGTCADVCRELGVYCYSADIRQGEDACEPPRHPEAFAFCWLHPPYWRQKLYSDDPRDLSRTPTLEAFLQRYEMLLVNSARSLLPGGKLAVLMGDYSDREAGFVPLVYYTKYLALKHGMRQHCTDIIRFSHGASSSRKVYRSSFIPGLHDVCMVFEKAA
jgi:hypothetical protein